MSPLAGPMGPSGHIIGRPNAPALLVEYGDYACRSCARAHYAVTEILRRFGNDVRYAYRHFPLLQRHPHALLAAQAAEAAGTAGLFWPMHALLLENQDALAASDLMRYAAMLGIDIGRFSRDIRTGMYLSSIESDFRCGTESGVDDTPTFFLNGHRVYRAWNTDDLGVAIRELLQRGRATPVVHAGSPIESRRTT